MAVVVACLLCRLEWRPCLVGFLEAPATRARVGAGIDPKLERLEVAVSCSCLLHTELVCCFLRGLILASEPLRRLRARLDTGGKKNKSKSKPATEFANDESESLYKGIFTKPLAAREWHDDQCRCCTTHASARLYGQ